MVCVNPDDMDLSKPHDPLVDLLEEIDDAVWRLSKDCSDSSEWWSPQAAWDESRPIPIHGLRDKIMESLKKAYDVGYHDCVGKATEICWERGWQKCAEVLDHQLVAGDEA